MITCIQCNRIFYKHLFEKDVVVVWTLRYLCSHLLNIWPIQYAQKENAHPVMNDWVSFWHLRVLNFRNESVLDNGKNSCFKGIWRHQIYIYGLTMLLVSLSEHQILELNFYFTLVVKTLFWHLCCTWICHHFTPVSESMYVWTQCLETLYFFRILDTRSGFYDGWLNFTQTVTCHVCVCMHVCMYVCITCVTCGCLSVCICGWGLE